MLISYWREKERQNKARRKDWSYRYYFHFAKQIGGVPNTSYLESKINKFRLPKNVWLVPRTATMACAANSSECNSTHNSTVYARSMYETVWNHHNGEQVNMQSKGKKERKIYSWGFKPGNWWFVGSIPTFIIFF